MQEMLVKTFAEACDDLRNDYRRLKDISEYLGWMEKNNPSNKLLDQKRLHHKLFYILFVFCQLDEMVVEYGENGEYIFELLRKFDEKNNEFKEFTGRIFKGDTLELECTCICDLKNKNRGYKITKDGSREGLKILLKNIAEFVFLTKQKG